MSRRVCRVSAVNTAARFSLAGMAAGSPSTPVSRYRSRGVAALSSEAMEPISASMAQGFTMSSYCPTPDQPRSPPLPAVNSPETVGMPLTEKPSSSPACRA